MQQRSVHSLPAVGRFSSLANACMGLLFHAVAGLCPVCD